MEHVSNVPGFFWGEGLGGVGLYFVSLGVLMGNWHTLDAGGYLEPKRAQLYVVVLENLHYSR